VPLELGVEVLLGRPADAQIGDEFPSVRNVERGGDTVRLED
jgi:hypothetical protein